MKRLFMIFAIAMLTYSMAMAVPAHPGKAMVRQPDGTMLTIRLWGDEYLHYNTTDDGYSIVRRHDGCYVYAQLDQQGQLSATNRVAHNLQERTADEQSWLQQIGKHLTPLMDEATTSERQAEYGRRANARQTSRIKLSEDEDNGFKGLILLVQFNDKAFSRSDYNALINDMANKENYTGFDNSRYGKYTGSVRDYFHDNSMGMFTPQFDVVGPITINYSQYYAKGTANAATLTLKAIEAADSLVDYSQYDGNGDGTVDMVYFIFAGIGSHMSGNDSRLIWPHASSIYRPNSNNWQVRADGVVLGRYACSTELYGTNDWSIIDGIGTICHEFSHVLGVMDLYDTDYEGSGGESSHPSTWSIMAGGSYENFGRTPVGYTAYERYSMGFLQPKVIEAEGSYTLTAISESNECYRLNSPVKKEYFLIENRQQNTKWDRYLPGHGMLVYRVDSTSTQVWTNNKANVNPKHNYMELLRAGGPNGSEARDSDPFPGSTEKDMLNNSTSPANLLTWAGKPNVFGFENIKEYRGEISFDIIDVNVLKSISLPAQVALGSGLTLQLTEECYPETAPYTLNWTSCNSNIAAIDNKGMITGVAAGETDIIVTANDDQQLKDTCHVIVKDIPIVKTIADFKKQSTDQESALLLDKALVLFNNGSDVYLRDDSGAILLSNTGLALRTGDMLSGSIYGKLSFNNGEPLLTGITGMTNGNTFTLTSDHEVKPREINVADVTNDDYGDLITLKAAPLESASGIWAVGGENKIRLYNTFKLKNITVPAKYEGKYYDITGIYHTNLLKNEVINEIALTKALTEVEAPVIDHINAALTETNATTPILVFTSDGRLAAKGTIATLQQLQLQQGIYIVKCGDKTWKIIK
ncbi:MAG: M6 family metalloprotease domain-containing protein [Prevotella sp.]|nr:M6 family metalloprotease domain-containing protein [Prevotella sp.]